ncbi:YlmH family RNA-binding protein [Lacticaseibacillus zhaodongensis]|uniref:YlmH family RNA-binding protein n=1 Tax=Lacticaseibacillus zhaodongensis TaxID=2668065 RepID=UPI0012D2BDFA|nr:YlmH/Sll1252 family protein [Lacticaseibacillus zhaodongensis]
MTQAGLFQHVRQDELAIRDRLIGFAATAANEYRPVVTPFLNPRSQVLAELAAEQAGVKLQANGGFTGAEWARVLFFPDYYEPQAEDYELQLLEVQYPQKFDQLRHSDILGALMNSGVARNVFGDIVGDAGRWQFATSMQMADFFKMNVQRIGRGKVELLAVDTPLRPHSDWQEHELILSSLRLDELIASAFGLARTRSKSLVQSGAVQVNWHEEKRADYQIAPSDMVSVREHGRVSLDQLLGLTQKEKWRAVIRVIDKRTYSN